MREVEERMRERKERGRETSEGPGSEPTMQNKDTKTHSSTERKDHGFNSAGVSRKHSRMCVKL